MFLVVLLTLTALFFWTLPTAVPMNGTARVISPDTDSDWWARFSQDLIAYEYVPSNNAHGLQAPNRAHNLRTYFEPGGIRVHDRTTADSPTLVSLSVAGLGRGTALAPVSPGIVRQQADRVEIVRPGLVEWYENSAQGLEQGFTLPERPQGKGSLVLTLAVADATASLKGQSVELSSDEGRRLRYNKLKAIDADGQTLFSRLVVPSPDRVYLVVNDIGAKYPLVIDPLLTAIPDTLLESNQPGSSGIKPSAFGRSVSGAGDVNGDGFADVIVGAWGWDGGENEEGAVFVFLGSATGIVGSNPADAHAQIESNQAGARLGWSVSGAGDVNGDGFGDIVAGAYLYRSLLFFEGWGELRVDGTVLVFHGSPTGIVGTDPLSADARIEGNQISSFLGFSVSGAGDVNGDGFDDIIVGVPREGIPFLSNISPNDRQGTGGAALVFLGSATGVTGTGFSDADTALLPYPPGFPALNGSGMGSSVSGAGDVNGDGFADVIVGAPGWSDGVNIGAAVVFLGSSTGLIGSDPASAHARLSSDPTTPMGADVAAAGDVNGDGFGDIIVGAPGFNGSGLSSNSMGAFMVFHGSTQGISATGPAGAQARFEGIMGGHQLGREVAAAGDIDGDGFDDVIVAALGYAGGLDQEGAAYVFRGSPAGIVGTSLRDDAYVRLESQQSRAAVNTVDLGMRMK